MRVQPSTQGWVAGFMEQHFAFEQINLNAVLTSAWFRRANAMPDKTSLQFSQALGWAVLSSGTFCDEDNALHLLELSTWNVTSATEELRS